jgi:hypothetical protein
MPRLILLLLSLFLSTLPAAAHDGDRQLCDGKYAAAQEMLDAAYGAYGTIYSGGPVESYRSSHVGPTIDLWRLWRGLPDLRFRDANTFKTRSDWGWDFSDFGRTSDDLAILLRIADRKQATGLSEVWRYITARYLNIMVDAGSGPGWWLAPTSRDSTKLQALVIEAAKPGSLMEWLLVMQADSDTPDSLAWVWDEAWTQSHEYPYGMKSPTDLVRELVSARRRAGPGLEWVAAAYVTYGSYRGFQEIHSGKVRDCTATPAEYALGAVETYEYFKGGGSWGGGDMGRLNILPEAMRLDAMTNLAKRAVFRTGQHGGSARQTEELARLAALSPSARFSSWLFAGRAWTAGSLDELIAFHDDGRLDPRALDTLNTLSVHDLAAFSDAVTVPDDQRRTLLTVIAGRAFTLGNLDLARRHLTELQNLQPENAALIGEALDGPGDKEVQVARALLALPTATAWLRDYHQGEFGRSTWGSTACCFRDIDLPLRYSSAAMLNRDLRQWIAAHPNPYSWSAARRANERGRVYDDRFERPFIPDDWQGDDGFPFLRLIAWDELAQLDVCHGLTNRLSEVLIAWVDQNSDSWLERAFGDDTFDAETLRQIILLNKRSPGALVDGQPAGQRAKRLLETRFAETEAAKATPYWYFEDRGCRD